MTAACIHHQQHSAAGTPTSLRPATWYGTRRIMHRGCASNNPAVHDRTGGLYHLLLHTTHLWEIGVVSQYVQPIRHHHLWQVLQCAAALLHTTRRRTHLRLHSRAPLVHPGPEHACCLDLVGCDGVGRSQWQHGCILGRQLVGAGPGLCTQNTYTNTEHTGASLTTNGTRPRTRQPALLLSGSLLPTHTEA